MLCLGGKHRRGRGVKEGRRPPGRGLSGGGGAAVRAGAAAGTRPTCGKPGGGRIRAVRRRVKIG
ncbi:hypothetical protein KCH_07330 [Kitasatospora cheerisanensis KCTC 2395]|uniref:Uncharacterized protein n=1 Tax=Kitasatospora cheerisanensis KCTC 2395 TaxID=1348663 RepID=A0A066Z1X3_9ACTN|nr:hypothetical protein KCH_07330 [Kitasatospora cheerisanensis KCTC 2395]